MESSRLLGGNFTQAITFLARSIFMDLGGFDVNFKRAEDDEFAVRLARYGCDFHFESRALAYHYSNRSLDAWLAIPRSYAYYDVEIDRLYPELGHLEAKKHELSERRFPLRARPHFARGTPTQQVWHKRGDQCRQTVVSTPSGRTRNGRFECSV